MPSGIAYDFISTGAAPFAWYRTYFFSVAENLIKKTARSTTERWLVLITTDCISAEAVDRVIALRFLPNCGKANPARTVMITITSISSTNVNPKTPGLLLGITYIIAAIRFICTFGAELIVRSSDYFVLICPSPWVNRGFFKVWALPGCGRITANFY